MALGAIMARPFRKLLRRFGLDYVKAPIDHWRRNLRKGRAMIAPRAKFEEVEMRARKLVNRILKPGMKRS